MAGIYDEQILGAKQQAETARKLREGITSPQGQMVSGWYVAPSITQYMANALKTYQSAKDEQKAQATYDEMSKTKAHRTAELLRQLQPRQDVTMTPEGAQQMMRPFNPGTTQDAINNAINTQPQPMMTGTNEVQPSEQQRMSALMQGLSVNPEAFQGQLKAEEWNMARKDKQDALQAAIAERQLARDQQFGQQRDMARLAASLRPAPAEKMIAVMGKDGNPIMLPQSQAAGMTPFNAQTAGAGSPTTRRQDAQDAMNILQQAAPLVDQATHSGAGNLVDAAAGFVGRSTPGADAAAQLKVLGGALVSKMPKMSGPQSDKDVQLYKEMAGRIGDPTVPVSQKKAAMQTINELQAKYAGADAPDLNFSQPTRTSTGRATVSNW